MQIHQLTSFTEQDFRDLAALMKELSDRLELTSKPARTAANALYSTLGFTRVDTNCYRIKL